MIRSVVVWSVKVDGSWLLMVVYGVCVGITASPVVCVHTKLSDLCELYTTSLDGGGSSRLHANKHPEIFDLASLN